MGTGLSAEPTAGEIAMRDVLVLKSVTRAGRSAVHSDPVEALIVSGQWHAPASGEVIATPGGDRTWESSRAGDDGWLAPANLRGGYIDWAVYSPEERVMILEAAGHNLAYVNGEIRTGDPYAYGYVHLPVLLHAGTNDLLFQCSRGRFRAKLVPPEGPLSLNTEDTTLPDIVLGERGPLRGAVVALNSTTHPIEAVLRTRGAKAAETVTRIPPLSVRKVGFVFYPPRSTEPGECPVTLEATERHSRSKVIARAQLKLRVRRSDQTYKRTFISAIDGSVQYYAVNPASRGSSDSPASALFLSLHGASVEAIGQADAYSPKPWGNLVCPTNRRPYGFDWEEWGRLDALEVLAQAEALFRPDPTRVYLTGHSMGGHGTWQLGAIYPDRFAAIGASAGWISFTSYVETNRSSPADPIEQILARANGSSDTLLLATNYLQEGVYILHGDADDNVPIREARQMRKVLAGFHHDFDFHEQPGAGHWWDASDEPGADCVDWAPMFDFFAHHVVPRDVSLRQVRFVTLNPAVSAHCHWVTVLAQEHALEPSRVEVRCDPLKRRLVGTTANIGTIAFELPELAPGSPLTIELDGQKLESVPWPSDVDCGFISRAAGLSPRPMVCLVHDRGQWALGQPPSAGMKNPHRSGPFRQAFNRHMLFVYGTHGAAGENGLTFAKARYDAETFWYRGNGAVEVLSDDDYLHLQKGKRESHNVILYGNAEDNAAWPLLLADSPVQVHRGSVKVGEREWSGADLACLFLRPFPGDDQGLVGVVAGSGVAGLRLSERLPYFLSGAGFPDCLVIGPDMLSRGIAGIRLAGFFGEDWGVGTGDFAGGP